MKSVIVKDNKKPKKMLFVSLWEEGELSVGSGTPILSEEIAEQSEQSLLAQASYPGSHVQ